MKLRKQLDTVLKTYIKTFEKKYKLSFDYAVNDDLMNILAFGDYFVNIQDVIIDIDSDSNEFINWYNVILEKSYLNEPTCNYQNWINGFR